MTKLSQPVLFLLVLTILSLFFFSYTFFTKENSRELVYIDVATKEGIQILASKKISFEDFHDLNVYQEFNLTFFSSTPEEGIEFRIKWLGDREVNLVIDEIKLYDLENHELIFWESAADKPQIGPSWLVTDDQEASGVRVVQIDSQVRAESWLYGPYLRYDRYGESLANRKLCASFRLKIVDTLLPIYVAELSAVTTYCLADTLIDLAQVKDENIYNTFNLTFTVPTKINQGFEFQVKNRNNGYCTLLVDDINVYKSDSQELVYSECSTDMFVSGEGWTQTIDLESSCSNVMFISSTQRNGQTLFGPKITTDFYGNSMIGKTYVVSFRIRIIKT
jgi:hypothetical protein